MVIHGLTSEAKEGGPTPEVERRVVDKVPDEPPHKPIGALVCLGRLNDLFLDRRQSTPEAHLAGVLLPVCTCNKACIFGSQRCREHSSTPGPVHAGNLQLPAPAVRCLVVIDDL